MKQKTIHSDLPLSLKLMEVIISYEQQGHHELIHLLSPPNWWGNYPLNWCAMQDLNLRPADYESDALTTELMALKRLLKLGFCEIL